MASGGDTPVILTVSPAEKSRTGQPPSAAAKLVIPEVGQENENDLRELTRSHHSYDRSPDFS